MTIYAEPALPTVPLPRSSEELDQKRNQTLEYIAFVAKNFPPDWAEREIPIAASRLVEIIVAEYGAIAREDAECEEEIACEP